jgi:ferritin-like metal-binding protein YciE
MALFSETIRDLKALYIHQLRLMLSSERHLMEALPEMEQAAADPELSSALHFHQGQTQLHAFHLEQILRELAGDDVDKRCAVTTGLISAARDIIKNTGEGPVRDAGIIASAQCVEHYEIGFYGTLRNWARMLGFTSHAVIFDTTLQEERQSDLLLTTISERLNSLASSASIAA